MKRPNLDKKTGLVVTLEAIEDFSKMKVSERLAWLDEMREFIFKTRPLQLLRGFAKGINPKGLREKKDRF